MEYWLLFSINFFETITLLLLSIVIKPLSKVRWKLRQRAMPFPIGSLCPTEKANMASVN